MRHEMLKKRQKLGLTQEEVAKQIGVNRNTYTSYETGTATPSLGVALKIKKVLKTKSDDIFLISNVKKVDKVKTNKTEIA